MVKAIFSPCSAKKATLFHLFSAFPQKGRTKNTRKWLEEFFSEIGLKTIGGQEFDWNRVEVRKDKVYYQLPFPLDLRGISFLRNGLYLGDLKKNRFEPSQPLALTLHKGDVEAVISLPVSDERLTRYLKGETLMIEPEEAAHKKRLASSLRGRLSSRLRKACKRNPEKQISCRLESITSPPQDICPH